MLKPPVYVTHHASSGSYETSDGATGQAILKSPSHTTNQLVHYSRAVRRQFASIYESFDEHIGAEAEAPSHLYHLITLRKSTC